MDYANKYPRISGLAVQLPPADCCSHRAVCFRLQRGQTEKVAENFGNRSGFVTKASKSLKY